MNIYQILDIRSGEVRAMLRARNRRQAAWRAAKAGRKYFRVRRLFRSMQPFRPSQAVPLPKSALACPQISPSL
jgi:hypothetical protein